MQFSNKWYALPTFRISFGEVSYTLCIGREGRDFSQLAILSITKEYYEENGEMEFAELLFTLG
jgi:hypothetical protein